MTQNKTNHGHTNWKVQATVGSESSNRDYTIDRADSGAIRCSCPSFRFKKFPLGHPSKTCKHISKLSQALNGGA